MVFGQKRELFKGKKKIHEILSRIQCVHRKVQALIMQELGSEVFGKWLNEIKEKVYVTLTSVRKGGAEENIKEIINEHVPSVKKQVSGIHYSPSNNSGHAPIWKTSRKMDQ
jgi:hypothetical protein